MIEQELAREALDEALRGGGSYADVFVQRRNTTCIRYEDGTVDDVSTGLDMGAGIRAIKGGLAVYVHTDILDRRHLIRAAGTASDALRHATEDITLSLPGTGRTSPVEVCPAGGSPGDIAWIALRLACCDETARSMSSEVRQVTAMHISQQDEILLFTSQGEVLENTCFRTRLVVQVIAARNGLSQTALEAPGFLQDPPAFYRDHDPAMTARIAAERALVMLDARPAPAGKMPVIMHSGTGGVLLHEASGHGLEADAVQKGASVFSERLGTRVASELVTAVDDSSVYGLWGSYPFDDEGTVSGETVLIEKGILKNFLYARHEAMKAGRPGTGNGRRQSFRHPPIPRMSNTFIREGDQSPPDIIAATARGLFARKIGGGQVDPATGDYVFAVSEGYLVEDGVLGPAVRGAMLIGNGPKTLESIDAVGNDLSFDQGTCGKEGQGVPVTTGCPTFRIAELTVGGTEV